MQCNVGNPDSCHLEVEKQEESITPVKTSDEKEENKDNQEDTTNENEQPEAHVGHYSDQHHIDVECEKLLRNTKKQVKHMMEEAVTKKFIHEESSSIISLCVAVDACLSHGLKRRALGLFKTNSSTALIQKVSKNCKSAQEVLDSVETEERRVQGEQTSSGQQKAGGPQDVGSGQCNNGSSGGTKQTVSLPRSPIKQAASNLHVHKRNLWIKIALIDKKLVSIVEHLAENSCKFYEPDALMSNKLCAQILSSLLVGPSALEFSHSKISDYYQFEDPTADELLKRHKLANPIACLCNSRYQHSARKSSTTEASQSSSNAKSPCRSTKSHNLSSSISNGSGASQRGANGSGRGDAGSSCGRQRHKSEESGLDHLVRRSPSPNSNRLVGIGHKEIVKRRPLSLKANTKRGTLVTDCHHYSCQERSEHQQPRGYSFLCSSSANATNQTGNSNSSITAASNQGSGVNSATSGGSGCNENSFQHQEWSPRMLHETLHQNYRSHLLYAKNNVLLETQPRETMAGYLSLHQTNNSDLILKWIPNQMINGSQIVSNRLPNADDSSPSSANNLNDSDCYFRKDGAIQNNEQPIAVESSYLDLVVSLSVSRIVLLHCQFGKSQNPVAEGGQVMATVEQADDSADRRRSSSPSSTLSFGSGYKPSSLEDTLILVEADGVQRAPFKFPKGGLRQFLDCLENGLRPDKHLEPAIRFDDRWLDPLQSPSADSSSSQQSPQVKVDDSTSLESPSSLASGDSQVSRFDSLLRRLPSLRRRPTAKVATSSNNESSACQQEESRSAATNLKPENPEDSNTEQSIPKSPCLPTENYVYRIVFVQQPDWPLQTPPHSALSVGSSTTSGSVQVNGGQTNGKQVVLSSGQKFRWSLSKLARFSARYTNSAGSTSSSSIGGGRGFLAALHGDSLGSLGSFGVSSQQTCDNNSICDIMDNNSINESNKDNNNFDDIENGPICMQKRDNSRELARIEAKLDDLKKSTSDDLLALRTQSIQTLCESMRRQIVARAFYGWLAHCRKVRIIKAHLLKLIKDDDMLIDSEIPEDSQLMRAYESGLTRDRWTEMISHVDGGTKEGDPAELELRLRREVNLMVYYGGIKSDELRREVWPYLLGHYKFADDVSKRQAKDKWARESYKTCGDDWIEIERVVKQRDHDILTENMAKASRVQGGAKGGTIEEQNSTDRRTISETSNETNTNRQSDLTQEDEESCESDQQINSLKSTDENTEKLAEDNGEEKSCNSNGKPVDSIKCQKSFRKSKDIKLAAKRRRRRQARLESTGSVGSDASITDRFGNNIHRIDKDVQRCDRNFWYFKDTGNLDKLRNIMCTYVWQHLDVGYVQGMCDLAAPFLVIFHDEVMAFNCFSQLMKRMESNFPHGCAMDQHFESLKYLMQILDPKLFELLQSNGDYTHFYFCYRWLLLDFKRELAYHDVYKVWETIWSARVVCTDHFVIFMALAMVRYYRDIIIENNMDFTDTIKFFNALPQTTIEMAERHDAKRITALARDCILELRNLIKS